MQENTVRLLEAALSLDGTVTEEEKARIIDSAKQGGGTDRLLKVKEAAELLAIHEKYFWTLARKEGIPIVHVGIKGRRVRRSDIDAFIQRGTEAGERRVLPHEFHALKEGK